MTTNLVETKTLRGFGDNDTSTMEQMFPANPLPTYEPKVLMQSILDGITQGNQDYGPVNMDYAAAPELTRPTGQVDQPFAFQPNLTSPGPGSINPADKPAPPDTQPIASSGAGSSESPAAGAASVSKQKIGELIFGSSQGT
jgi:hypothetical protein